RIAGEPAVCAEAQRLDATAEVDGDRWIPKPRRALRARIEHPGAWHVDAALWQPNAGNVLGLVARDPAGEGWREAQSPEHFLLARRLPVVYRQRQATQRSRSVALGQGRGRRHPEGGSGETRESVVVGRQVQVQ